MLVKRLFSVLLVSALLLSLVSCAARVPSKSTSGDASHPPVTTDETPPYPGAMTEERKISLLASALQKIGQKEMPFCGSLCLILSDGDADRFSLEGSFHGQNGMTASVRLHSESDEALRKEIYLRDRMLYLLHYADESAVCLSESPRFEAFFDRAESLAEELQFLLDLLDRHGPALSLLLDVMGHDLDPDDLYAVLSFFGSTYARSLDSLGVSISSAPLPDGSAESLARAICALFADEIDDNGALLLTPGRL